MRKNHNNWYAMSDPALVQFLGNYIKRTRLKQNKTQQDIADVAGIYRTTLIKMEKGIGGTLLSFIQVLRALEQLQILENFEIEQALSPLQLAKIEKKKRRRASKNSDHNNKSKSAW